MHINFHYLLMANQAMVQKNLLTKLKDTGLTVGQPRILDYLKDHDGQSQKEIARGCHIEPSTLTSILHRMEEKNIIERRMLHNDRRFFYIFLTPKGKELQQIVEKAFAEIEENALTGVSPEEAECFLGVLTKIYENIGRKDNI